MLTHRHGHLSNAIEQNDQQAKEGEPGNLLPVVWADRMYMRTQEERRRAQAHHDGSLDESELTLHEGLPPLQPCSHAHRLLTQTQTRTNMDTVCCLGDCKGADTYAG